MGAVLIAVGVLVCSGLLSISLVALIGWMSRRNREVPPVPQEPGFGTVPSRPRRPRYLDEPPQE